MYTLTIFGTDTLSGKALKESICINTANKLVAFAHFLEFHHADYKMLEPEVLEHILSSLDSEDSFSLLDRDIWSWNPAVSYTKIVFSAAKRNVTFDLPFDHMPTDTELLSIARTALSESKVDVEEPSEWAQKITAEELVSVVQW